MRYCFLLLVGSSLSLPLVSGCSHSTPDSGTAAEAARPDVPAPAKPTYGTKVDSLDGIPGHRFGEPLSTFPGLLAGQLNEDGMRRYYYPSDGPTRDRGWFGKHRKELVLNYYFADGKFAYFSATAYGEYRKTLGDEATYLFGPGERFQLTGTLWKGGRARAAYTEIFSPDGPATRLDVVSEPLEAQQKERTAARLKAENDAP